MKQVSPTGRILTFEPGQGKTRLTPINETEMLKYMRGQGQELDRKIQKMREFLINYQADPQKHLRDHVTIDSVPSGFQQLTECGRRTGKESLTRMWLDIQNKQAQGRIKTEPKLSRITLAIRTPRYL